MKSAHLIFSTGTLHLLKNSIKPQGITLRTFICSTQEEVTDAFHSGVLKAEFHSLIHKLFKLIGHYLLNGVAHNTKESKNGG
jgi:hypothetical protein